MRRSRRAARAVSQKRQPDAELIPVQPTVGNRDNRGEWLEPCTSVCADTHEGDFFGDEIRSRLRDDRHEPSARERTCRARGESASRFSRRDFDELPAAWGDLDTWSRYVPATDETEVGIGLKTAGADTTMLVAFSARMKGASPSQAPSEVFVHASAGVNANAGNVRNKTLKFVLDIRAGRRRRTASCPRRKRSVGRSDRRVLAAGGRRRDSRRAGEFRDGQARPGGVPANRQSGQPTATVLGVDVAFRPDQLRALRAFANRIF